MITVIYSPEFLNHRTGRMHPESPQRLTAIYDRLQESQQLKPHLQWLEPTPVEQSQAKKWVEASVNKIIRTMKKSRSSFL